MYGVAYNCLKIAALRLPSTQATNTGRCPFPAGQTPTKNPQGSRIASGGFINSCYLYLATSEPRPRHWYCLVT